MLSGRLRTESTESLQSTRTVQQQFRRVELLRPKRPQPPHRVRGKPKERKTRMPMATRPMASSVIAMATKATVVVRVVAVESLVAKRRTKAAMGKRPAAKGGNPPKAKGLAVMEQEKEKETGPDLQEPRQLSAPPAADGLEASAVERLEAEA